MLEAIILAGGLGTRLKSEIFDVPKPMAPIADRPFLFYLIDYLRKQEVGKIHLSLYYKAEEIINKVEGKSRIQYNVEKEPLGTGGAILHNLQFVNSKHIVIVNGDVFCNLNLSQMFNFHLFNNSKFTIAAVKIKNVERFGVMKLNKQSKIIKFTEKQKCKTGYINAGFYIAEVKYLKHQLEKIQKTQFSLEKDFFENNSDVYAFKTDEYFIDIGTPEDYKKAQKELIKFLK